MKKSKTNNKKTKDKAIIEFLKESNAIEDVHGEDALVDAYKAWSYLSDKSFLTPEVIMGGHHFLMANLRPDIAGFWRNCDVWIGGHKKKFISVQLIEDEVRQFCEALNLKAPLLAPKDYAEETTKQLHIRFEDIHPFEDGNGRIGRMIYLWHRLKLGLPVHIIHADWPKVDGEQKRYYDWFKK